MMSDWQRVTLMRALRHFLKDKLNDATLFLIINIVDWALFGGKKPRQ